MLTAVAIAVLLAVCSGGDVALDPLPPPPSTQARPSTTAPPDFTGVALPAVPGRATTTTVALGPGKATVKGTVLSPDGIPVEGATVRVERMVGKAVASIDVASAADGSWSAQNVLGGGYRVRTWKMPDLAISEPAFFFVGATETYSAELKMVRSFGTTPLPAVAPNPPVVGAVSNLVLQLTFRSVDPSGVVNGVAMVGVAVELAGGSGWTVTAANPTVTDASGRARWELVCQAVGVQALRLVVNGAEQFQLALPACADPPAPPTTATPGSTVPGASTTRPPGTTTTTRPAVATTTTRPPGTTTTTTRPAGTTTTMPATPTTKKP